MIDGRRDLTTSFECNGYFWLEDDASNVVAGTLRYDPETGSSLELLGRLHSPEIEIGTIELLRGVSSKNEKLTLLNCIPRRTQLQQGLFEIQHFRCEVALVGNFYPEPTLTFQRSGIRFDKLDHWLKSDYVKTERVSKSDVGRGLGITVSAGLQGTLECERGGYKVHLEAEYSSRADGYNVELNAFTTLYIVPETHRNLRWFFDEGRILRDFAALCFGSPLPLRSVRLLGGQLSIADGITITEVVAAFFVEQAPATPSRASYPLIMFRRFELAAPGVLSAWHEKREQFQEVIDLVFLVLYGHHTRPEVGFLLIMQAFEAFDRKVNPGTLTSPEKFKEVYDAMVGAIPQLTPNDLRQKMKAAIQYANEPSLRKRLKLFHDRLVSLVGPEPYGFKSSSIEPLVQTRNYYTHYPEDLKDKILSPSSTGRETDRFSMLLVVCLLHEIGVTLDQTRNGLFLHDKFRRFMADKALAAEPEKAT
jgi:hypothetical protein